MKKKLFSTLLAAAIIASLAIPALATGGTTPQGGAVGKDLEYDTSTNIPTVTVTMPASPSVILNPYGMTVQTSVISGGSVVSGDVVEQIVSPVLFITNKTQAPMKVGVKATATVSGNAVLSAKPCTGKETTLNAFLMAELAQNPNSTSEPDWFVDLTDATTINEKCYPQIIPTAEGKTAAAILSVDKTNGTAANYIAIKVTGNLAGNPTGGWTSADTVGLKLEFTFTPGVANAVAVASGVTSVEPSKTDSVMGAVVRLTSSDDKQPVVQDAAGANVTVNKVQEKLYYFVMPATAVTVTGVT